MCRSRWWAPRQQHHRPVVICHSWRFNITQCVALRSLACGRQLQTQETRVIIEPTDKQEPHLQHNINLSPRVVYIIFSSVFFHDCYECARGWLFQPSDVVVSTRQCGQQHLWARQNVFNLPIHSLHAYRVFCFCMHTTVVLSVLFESCVL